MHFCHIEDSVSNSFLQSWYQLDADIQTEHRHQMCAGIILTISILLSSVACQKRITHGNRLWECEGTPEELSGPADH